MLPSRQLTARLSGYPALLRRAQQAVAAVQQQQPPPAETGRLGPLEAPTMHCSLPGRIEFATASQIGINAEFSAAAAAPAVTTGDAALELTARPCPAQLRRDLASLLGPDAPSASQLTVLTVAHRTLNDMSAWSPQVQSERESLTEQFVASAGQLCRALRSAGFWCDFVDPTSGRPFDSVGGSDALFETDERYRYLGFQIEDLGCCKVLMHTAWGARVFVGAVFTNAPMDHPLVAGPA